MVLQRLLLTDVQPIVKKALTSKNNAGSGSSPGVGASGPLTIDDLVKTDTCLGGKGVSIPDLYKKTIDTYYDPNLGMKNVKKTIVSMTKKQSLRPGIMLSIIMGICFSVVRPVVVKTVINEITDEVEVNYTKILLLMCGGIVFEGLVYLHTIEFITVRFYGDFIAIITNLLTHKMSRVHNKAVIDEGTLVAIDAYGKSVAMGYPLAFLPANLTGIFFGGGFLIYLLGVPGLIGFIFTLFMQLVGMIVMKKSKKWEAYALEQTDVRMSLSKELMMNMKGVKYQSWEYPYMVKLKEMRLQETMMYEKFHKTKLVGANLGRTLPIIASCFTFLMVIAMGGELTSDIIFPVLTVFQGMRTGFVMIPLNLVFLGSLKLSFERLQQYMDQVEIKNMTEIMDKDEVEKNSNNLNNNNVVFTVQNLTVAFPPDTDLSQKFGKGVMNAAELQALEDAKKKKKKGGKKLADSNVNSEENKQSESIAATQNNNSDSNSKENDNHNIEVKVELPTLLNKNSEGQVEDSDVKKESATTSTLEIGTASAVKVSEIAANFTNSVNTTVTNDESNDSAPGVDIIQHQVTELSPEDQPHLITVALDDITLDTPITQGMTVVIGNVGSGKTTLLQSLMGEREVLNSNTHNIIGDFDIERHPDKCKNQINLNELHPVCFQHKSVCDAINKSKVKLNNASLKYTETGACFGYQPQKTFAISGTIEENVVFGRPEVTRQKMIKALARSCLIYNEVNNNHNSDENNSEKSLSLQTQVTDFGASLSGGQLLRLNLARAWATEPDILVVDDPLSAVDATSATHIFANLLAYSKLPGKTVIMATSHLRFLKFINNRILVLDSGKLLNDSTDLTKLMETLDQESALYEELSEEVETENMINDSMNLNQNLNLNGQCQAEGKGSDSKKSSKELNIDDGTNKRGSSKESNISKRSKNSKMSKNSSGSKNSKTEKSNSKTKVFTDMTGSQALLIDVKNQIPEIPEPESEYLNVTKIPTNIELAAISNEKLEDLANETKTESTIAEENESDPFSIQNMATSKEADIKQSDSKDTAALKNSTNTTVKSTNSNTTTPSKSSGPGLHFLSLFGKKNLFLIVFYWFVAYGSLSFSEYSLAAWVSEIEQKEKVAELLNKDSAPDVEFNDDAKYYLIFLFLFIFGSLSLGMNWYKGAANAGRIIHNTSIMRVLGSPLKFIEKSGMPQNILSSLSTDLQSVDNQTSFLTELCTQFCGVLLAICIVQFAFLPLAGLVTISCLSLMLFVLLFVMSDAIIACRRFGLVLLNPLLQNFAEFDQCRKLIRSTHGFPSTNDNHLFLNRFYPRIENFGRAYCTINRIHTWTTIFFYFVATCQAAITIYLLAENRASIDSGLIGLTVSHCFLIPFLSCLTSQFMFMLTQGLVSVDRVIKLKDVPQEERDEFRKQEESELMSLDWNGMKKKMGETFGKKVYREMLMSDSNSTNNIQSDSTVTVSTSNTDSNLTKTNYIQFTDVSMQYSPELPLAIKNLSLKIHLGEHIGLCGTTGCGKSSVTAAMYRIVPQLASGSIEIGGIDIHGLNSSNTNSTKLISLKELRSQMQIVTQNPFLISGTVQQNLDPFDEFDVDEIQTAFNTVFGVSTVNAVQNQTSIKDVQNLNDNQSVEKDNINQNYHNNMPIVTKMSTRAENASGVRLHLNSRVEPGGSNLSGGESQLLAFTRLLLRKDRVQIIILDEPTSSLDFETDRRIMKLLHEEFKGKTVLLIAHRLDSLIDKMDKIMVLENGNLVDFASPKQLLENGDSFFTKNTRRGSVMALGAGGK